MLDLHIVSMICHTSNAVPGPTLAVKLANNASMKAYHEQDQMGLLHVCPPPLKEPKVARHGVITYIM